MKKNIPHFFILSLLVLIFNACQKEQVVDDIVTPKSKLVSAIFLSAGDSEIFATLALSTPVIGTASAMGPNYYSSASVRVFTTNKKADLVYDSIVNYYYGIMPALILPREEYNVSIVSSLGEIHGTTTIPDKIETNLSEVFFDSTDISYGMKEYHLSIKCNVLTPGNNLVRLIPFIVYSDSSKYEMESFTDNVKVIATGNSSIFNKKFNSIYGFNGVYPARIEIWVLNCDENYSKYVNSVSGINFSDLLPGSEPKISFSNMSNKIGVIGSYNISNVYHFKF